MNCFCRMVDWSKPYFELWPLSEIFIITNLWQAVSLIWACTEPEFRLCWIKLCANDKCKFVGNFVSFSDIVYLVYYILPLYSSIFWSNYSNNPKMSELTTKKIKALSRKLRQRYMTKISELNIQVRL